MKIERYFDTIRYLKPVQIKGQIHRKLFKTKISKNGWKSTKVAPKDSNGLVISRLDEDEEYIKRFNAQKLLQGEITLLHEAQPFDGKQWMYAECTPLWNFNLQYFEYAISVACFYKKTHDKKCIEWFTTVYESWLNSSVKEAWHPYTISLRIRNLLIAKELYGADLPQSFAEKLNNSVYDQYCYLKKHTETDILGNHYFENLCTIVLCTLLYGESKDFRKWSNRLNKEIQEEILYDGVHFERSLMYHKLILEDILRITNLLFQLKNDKYKDYLGVLQKMLDAAVSLESGMNRTPLFNDSGDNVAKSVTALQDACKEIFNMEAHFKTEFPASGYYLLEANDLKAIIDAGPIGPTYIPGHVHCDALSFEIFKNSKPVFVNSGTGLYQGKLRQYFRSTEAHNTVTINNHQQSECWAEHRVARRLKAVSAQVNGNKINCRCVNYLGEIHERSIQFGEQSFEVSDTTFSQHGAEIKSYLHIDPEYTVKLKNGVLNVYSSDNVLFAKIQPINCDVSQGLAQYAPDFGQIEENTVVCFNWYENGEPHGYRINFF